MFSLIRMTSSNGESLATGDLVHQSGSSVKDEVGAECGVHGSWSWDGSTFILKTDQYGYLPYYYHHDPLSGELVVSDSPQEVASSLGHCRFDSRAIGFFARSGFMLGDSTLYEGVRRASANSTLQWSAGVLHVTSGEVGPATDQPRSVEEALDGWIERFRVAMKRRVPTDDSIVMPLSAGRDSRMMLLELNRLDSIPRELVTIGSRANDDVRIARLIADRMNIPFRLISPTRLGWVDIEKHRHELCGFEAIEHSWLIPLWQDLSRNGSGWFDGLGCGAVIRNSVNDEFALDLLRSKRDSDWARLFFTRTAAPSEDWIDRITQCSPVPIASHGEVVDFMQEELDHHRDRPNPITSFTFHNWGRRSIALNPFGICRRTTSIGVPFMDRDLVEWSLSIPAEWCFDHDIQTRACHRLYPGFADVPFTLGGKSNRNPRHRMTRLLSYLQRKRFFRTEAACFRQLHDQVVDNSRANPASFRAVTLMAHLTLVDKTVASA